MDIAWSTLILASSTTSEAWEMDDAERLEIEQAQRGDPVAFQRISERYKRAITQQLWRYERNQEILHELTQDVFMQVYTSLPSYRFEAPLLFWLRKIASRVGYRYWKRQASRMKRTVPLHEELVNNTLVHSEIREIEMADLVQRILGQLSPSRRMVITLYYLEDCSLRDIARRMDWSETYVKVQLYRARKQLKALLDKLGIRDFS